MTFEIDGVPVEPGDPVRVTGIGRGPNDSSYDWVFRSVTDDGHVAVFGGKTGRLKFERYFPADRVLPASKKQLKAKAEAARRAAEKAARDQTEEND